MYSRIVEVIPSAPDKVPSQQLPNRVVTDVHYDTGGILLPDNFRLKTQFQVSGNEYTRVEYQAKRSLTLQISFAINKFLY